MTGHTVLFPAYTMYSMDVRPNSFFYTGFLEPLREASHTHMISSSAHGTCLAFDSLFFSVIVKWQYSMTAAFETFVQH